MIETIIVDVISATASLVFVACCGVYLCKQKLLDAEKLSYLSRLVEQLFLPCLIFSSFIKTLDLTQVEQWLMPMIISIVSIFQGMLLGYVINKYLIKDKKYESIIVLSSGLAMTTQLQLNLSETLHDYLDEISHQIGYESIYSGQLRATRYVMIYIVINTIITWTLAKEILIKLRKEYENTIYQEQQLSVQNNKIELQDIIIGSQNDNQINKSNDDMKQSLIQSQETSPTKVVQIKEQSIFMSIFSSPPIQMSFLSILICFIPPLRDALIEEGSFLNRAIFQPSASIGHIILPLVLMTLGGNLYLTWQSSYNSVGCVQYEKEKISNKTLAAITIIRLIIMPIIGYVTILFFNFFDEKQDPVFQFISQISYSTPSAINLLIITTVHFPKTAKEMAKVLLSGYSFNIITLPIVMVLFFNSYNTK